MTLNLGGMQSISMLTGGIDYSQIITQLTQAARAPGDALNDTIQQLQLKKNDWGDILTLSRQLQNALDTMTDSTTFDSFTTTVNGMSTSGGPTGTNVSNPSSSIWGVTADSTAVPGTYVISVPTSPSGIGSYASSTSSNSIGAAVSETTAVSNAVFSQPITTGALSVTINGVTHSYQVGSSDTIASVLNGLFGTGSDASPGQTPAPQYGVTWSLSNNVITINNTNSVGNVTFGSAGDASNFLKVLGLTGVSLAPSSNTSSGAVGHAQVNQTLGSSSANLGLAVQITNQPAGGSTKGAVSINGVEVDYDTSVDTLQSFINSINASSAGVTASYDASQDKVILTSKTSQPITVQDMQLADGSKGNLAQVLALPTTSVAGNSWTYTINGVQHTSSSPTVSGVIPGVTFTIQQTGDSTLVVAPDTGTLTKNVQAFADAFNSLYSKLQDYTKKGSALQGDAVMAQLAFNYMNDVLTDKLPNVPSQYAGQTVFNIGINNGAVGATPGTTNSLKIDATALSQAFQNDPNRVKSLITSMSQNLNRDLVNVTGYFNQTWLDDPNSTGVSRTLTAMGPSEQNMYDQMISNVEKQQQSIYDLAAQQAQNMKAQFTQLQQYQAQTAMQMNAIRAMMGVG